MAPAPRILASAFGYWTECIDRCGLIRGSVDFLGVLWQFLLDSTPSRLRSRFGDAEFDWDYRVNTTSGAVGYLDRLRGIFHSPYQPTERALFHEMLDALARHADIDFAGFTFIDLGSGKGRALLMASDYPFSRVIGVELLPSLHEIAQQNIAQYRSDARKCTHVESICSDATTLEFAPTPLVIYLFNPFPESGLRRAIANLEKSLEKYPRPVYVIYHNPQMEPILTESGHLRRMAGTHQYSIYAAAG